MREIFCILLSIIITFMSCSPKTIKVDSKEEIGNLKENSPQIKKEKIEEEVVVIQSEPIVEIEEEEMPMFEDAPVEEEEMPTFVDQTYEGQIEFVRSDLSKEFPKEGHIRVGKQLGIEIEDIYYYNNMSQILAMYVNTPKVKSEAELKQMQTNMYKMFQLNSPDITTIVKKGGTPYAIISSRKNWEGLTMVVYDYKNLMDEFSSIKKEIIQNEKSPLKTKKIFGAYFDPGLLSHKKKSVLREMGVSFILEDKDVYTKHSAYVGRFGLADGSSTTLSKGSDNSFYDSKNRNTYTVCYDGSLLSRSSDSNFKEKYNNFLMKID